MPCRNHHLSFNFCQITQGDKRHLGISFQTVIQQRIIETLQLSLHTVLLVFLVYWRNTCMQESDSPLKRLLYQESLAYTATTIYCNKLRTVTLIVSFQFQDLQFPTNYITHICVIFCRKGIKKYRIRQNIVSYILPILIIFN